MIVFIEGILLGKESDKITVNVNGIGYECNISGFTYDSLPDIGNQVSLHTYLNISENNHSLFGFLNVEEKKLFKMLIGVNGVGPKTAMPILSSAKPNDIINRIVTGDVKMLSSLPGIGPKSAKRIIVELKDKLSDYSISENIVTDSDKTIASDAIKALNSLGYSGIAVTRAIESILLEESDIDIEALIKETLKKIK